MPVGAVLFSEMTPEPSWEDRFNHWYDAEHIPLRMTAPGFLGAQRYRAEAGSGYLAVYDMASTDALTTPDYTRIKTQPSDETAWMLGHVSGFTRYIGSLISWQAQPGIGDAEMLASPVLFAVMFNVPRDRQEDFNRWYVEEHVPLLLGSPDWLGCRRYELTIADPHPYTHLALHHLRSADALKSEAREKARSTDWRKALAAEPWFNGHYAVFERHNARFNARAEARS